MKKILFFCIFPLICLLVQAEEAAKPIATDITAAPFSSNKIVVSWTLPAKTKDYYISQLLLYRSTKPIVNYSELTKLTPLARLSYNSVSYTDTLTDYKTYFYAVISIIKKGDFENYTNESKSEEELYYDEELDGKKEVNQEAKLYLLILPGVNATVKGCRVTGVKSLHKQPEQVNEKAKEYTDGTLREQPLPYLDIDEKDSNKKKPKIKSSTEEQALTLLRPERKKKEGTEILDPYIFQEDVKSPAGGDDYLLFEVLKGAFIKQDYKKAIDDIKIFLAQNRSKSVTDRANFYLGEAYYFCAMYPQALNQFLMLEETYTVLSRKWSKSTLDLYTIPPSPAH